MNNIGLMYFMNPKNGNLVNVQTGKDIEIISWEDLVKDVKKIIIGIDGNSVYAAGVENAIIPFQEWLAKEHPEIDLSLHSGSMDNLKVHHTHIHLQTTHYGLYIAMAELNSGKTGKMAKFIQQDEGETEITIHVDKNRKESPFSSKAMNIPLGQAVKMSEEDKDKVVEGIRKTNELLKSGHPLINQHFTAGISPGRFYMMGSHTDASKSKLTKTSEVREHLNNIFEHKTRPYQVFLGFSDPSNTEANSNACKALASALPEMVDEDWVGVEKEQDADLGLVFNGQWWIITKCRGSMNGIVGNRLVSQVLLDEACRNVNVEDAYPKTTTAQLPKGNPTPQMNTYDIDWTTARHGILIIVDVQKDMPSGDSELNGQMLRRVTDAILSQDLNQHILIKGDTDCDYETRLEDVIDSVSCLINIAGGEAEIEKFTDNEQLVGTNIW